MENDDAYLAEENIYMIMEGYKSWLEKNFKIIKFHINKENDDDKEGVSIQLQTDNKYKDKIKEYNHSLSFKTSDLLKNQNIEACEYKSIDKYKENLDEKIEFFCENGLLKALHLGFVDHQPVELKADNFWLLILQGVAIHEELTGVLGKIFELPDKEKKKKITIIKDDFIMGSKENDWKSVFNEFEEKIKKNIPVKLYDLIGGKKYSTTTEIDKLCYSIVLMDSLKDYISYYVATSCFIPEIKLAGKKKDWEDLVEHTTKLSTNLVDLNWWFETIIPILKQFVLLFDGKADKEFWNSIYKFRNGSGGAVVTGYISLFFPYLLNWEGKYIKNKSILKSKREIKENQKEDEEFKITKLINPYYPVVPWMFPNGVSCVSFVWNYYGVKYDYNIFGGFFGCKQTERYISPSLGYAIGSQI